MLLLQWHTVAEHPPSVTLLESKNVLFCENESPQPAVTAIQEFSGGYLTMEILALIVILFGEPLLVTGSLTAVAQG